MVGDIGVARQPVWKSEMGLRIGGTVLLVLAGAFALGGSFGTFSEFGYDYGSPSSSGSNAASTLTYTGWRAITDPPATSDVAPTYVPLDGFPIAVGVVLALLAVMVLVTTGRRPAAHVWGRSVGVGAGALLAGVIAEVWMGLLANYGQVYRQIAAAETDGSGTRYSYAFGFGAWLELAAFACAVAAVVLLLLSAWLDHKLNAPRCGP